MTMHQFEKSPLWADVKDIIYSGKKPVRFEFKGLLHTEKEDIPILRLVSIDTVRDYVNNIGDHILLEFKMPLGEYIFRLLPFKTNLEVTIKQTELEETRSVKEDNSVAILERFKAVFLTEHNVIPTLSDLDAHDIESLNKVDIVTVKLQLLNRSLEPLRIKTVNGIFRQVTQKQIIHNLTVGESNMIQIDGKPAIDGIDIVEPDNKEIKKHIVIPHGTHVLSIPSFLQERMGGVYSSGIGTYMQTYKNKRLWFVYPLYDLKRFEENVDRVIFYSVPQERFPSVDRSYSKTGSILRIVATAQKKYQDSADVDYMNKGVGFRMPDARSFMKKPIEVTSSGPKGRRTNLNHEVGFEDREDGLNYAPMVSSSSSNPFREYSNILARNVARIDLVWENANPSLLYPGMPCKFVSLVNGLPKELKGIIVFVHAFTSLQGTTVTSSTYRTMCQITILSENMDYVPDKPKIKAYGNF